MTPGGPGMAGSRIDIRGVRCIARDFVHLVIHLAALFLAAGTMRWINAWILAGLSVAFQAVSAAILLKFNPGLLNRRGQVIQPGTKSFDKVFVAVYAPLALAVSVVCGLDVRFGWAALPLAAVAGGVLLFIASCGLGLWAMAVNRHFEATVFIGDPEVHKVCDRGPYRIIRHPGYAAAVLGLPSYGLILGSGAGLAASSLLIIVFIVRAALEDKTLLAELPGYREYAARVRHRLLPGGW